MSNTSGVSDAGSLHLSCQTSQLSHKPPLGMRAEENVILAREAIYYA